MSHNALPLALTHGELRADSRVLAGELRNTHRPVIALIDKYLAKFEGFGKVFFQKAPVVGSSTGQSERVAFLNEDQCYYLLALSRNTEHVVDLKAKLVMAFREARAGRLANQAEYLPGYHALHDRFHDLAAGSANEKFVHMNVNKLVNKSVGIGPGQRSTLAVPAKAAVIVAQHVAMRAAEAANDHHDGYAKAKQALGALSIALQGGAHLPK